MAVSAHLPSDASDRETVLTRATVRAAERLAISARELAQILGISEPSVSRMKSGAFKLNGGSKPFELAALFVRLFRSLDSVVGGDGAVAKAWMRTDNLALGGVPAVQIATVTGLVDVVAYLDARRAPL